MQQTKGGHKMFSGSITALVTPMDRNGEIDYDALQILVDRQLQAGTQALVVNGTTGEAPTLSKEEQQKIFHLVVEQVNHRIPVIAGTGSYSTKQTIENSKMAMQFGVDACLIITPYYNKPTQLGLYEHFKAIAENVPIPIILYNAPGRTGCDLLPKTVEKLSHIANIVAVKECVMTASRMEELLCRCGDKLSVLTGNDEDALPAMLLGFKGVISVTANIAPQLMKEMCDAALSGNKNKAREINQKLLLLHQKLFVESNPIPAKWLLKEMGLIKEGIRLPLTQLSEKYHEEVKLALSEIGENV
jgi:4-hydroxy-tetrahydrodipicolinate synthase